MSASGNTSIDVCFTDSGKVADVLTFSWWENSQSISDNTTNVGWKLELVSYEYGYIQSSVQKSWAITVNGENYGGKNTVGISSNSSKVLASGSTVIKHNDDGSKNFSYSFSQTFDINFNGKVGTKSASGNGTLTTIARASQPSCITYPNHTQNVGSFGDTISIHMNRKSSVFTHTVRYAFGDLTGICINAETGKNATGIETGFKWKIPESLMNLIPNNESGSGTIYVDTYNGSTLIDTKGCGFTATVPASVKPTCTATLEDINGIDEIYGSPVQGLSKIKVTVNPSLAYSSPIKTYEISIDGLKYSKSEITTDFLTKPGTSPVTVIVTDSRGRSNKDNPWTFNMNVQAYTPPAITKLVANRCNDDGTPNKRGENVKVTFSAVISAMGNKNSAYYLLKYKKTSESDDKYIEFAFNNLAMTYMPTDQTYIFAASKGSSYDVVMVPLDRHNTYNPASKSTKAPTASSIFSWRGFRTSAGIEEGAGIGKIPEKANTLQVGWDAEFEKEVYYKGKTLLDYFYPVGSIYTAYNHTNPGTLFGGTWVRIEEAFLWATGSGTIGQTGGEKTHTLTVDELPSHSHGSVYSQHATGTKDKAWYTTSGSSVAYGTVATGSGQAHNNMPPYIQVSMWRRTA